MVPFIVALSLPTLAGLGTLIWKGMRMLGTLVGRKIRSVVGETFDERVTAIVRPHWETVQEQGRQINDRMNVVQEQNDKINVRIDQHMESEEVDRSEIRDVVSALADQIGALSQTVTIMDGRLETIESRSFQTRENPDG